MNKDTEIIMLGEHKGREAIEGSLSVEAYYFKNQKFGKYNSKNKPCFSVENHVIKSHYYIGVDWLCPTSNRAIYVSPKLNSDGFETDYLKMLLTCLNDAEASKYISNVYEIKSGSDPIEISQSLDLLSPLLIIQYLNLVKQLVKKGLRKSYYREEKHLNARVKGKLLVSKTLKHNTYRNEPLKTVCTYDTFGLNHPENQVLKAGLLFVKKYLSAFPEYAALALDALQYCLPAFEEVKVPKNISGFKHFKPSALFSNYKEAIRVAQLILKRFGHNVRTIETSKIHTQPFWINMPLLFELYAFAILRKSYAKNLHYQYKSNYQELDFLLTEEGAKYVIDTKYKTKYGRDKSNKEDIRQLAGYARMDKVYKALNIPIDKVVDCLIIYPIRDGENKGNGAFSLAKVKPIPNYVGFYSLGLHVPCIKTGAMLN